ncbi:MAG: hypothetical protein O9333_02185 [Beijerinckiaceae bacterium]|nr:hypothetical protein [Beijerinckiaceae bacterium]
MFHPQRISIFFMGERRRTPGAGDPACIPGRWPVEAPSDVVPDIMPDAAPLSDIPRFF